MNILSTAKTVVAYAQVAVAGVSAIYIGTLLTCETKAVIDDYKQERELKKLRREN